MKKLFRVLPGVVTFLCLSSTSFAQGLTLKDRSVVELDLGMWGGTSVSNTIGVSGIQSTANASSFVGSLLYAYGIREDMSVTVSAGVLAAGASATVGLSGVSQESGSVVPLLLGVRYYVPPPQEGAKVRPFVSVGVGTYLATESSNSVGLTVVQESHTESAFGGRIGAGIDFYIDNNLKLVANAGYNVMSDFSSPVTGRMNFNGGDLSVGVGYAF